MKTYGVGYRMTEIDSESDIRLESESDIRLEKVRAVREEIQGGAYRIDYDKMAEKMLAVFIDEMSAIPAVRSNIFLVECVGVLS